MVALLASVVVGAWVLSWREQPRLRRNRGARVDAVRQLVQETPNRPTAGPDADPRRRWRPRASLPRPADSGKDVPWSLGFGLYQGAKLDGAARAAYERMLVDAVLPRLALRVEEQLRSLDQPESHYEALKAYLMMYDPARFDASALKSHIEADWDVRLGREMTTEQRERLSSHLDRLLARGPAVSPLPQDKALVDTTRARLAAVPLPQRVYNRMRQQGLGAQFPEFTVVNKGGGNARAGVHPCQRPAADARRARPVQLRRLPQGFPVGGRRRDAPAGRRADLGAGHRGDEHRRRRHAAGIGATWSTTCAGST